MQFTILSIASNAKKEIKILHSEIGGIWYYAKIFWKKKRILNASYLAMADSEISMSIFRQNICLLSRHFTNCLDNNRQLHFFGFIIAHSAPPQEQQHARTASYMCNHRGLMLTPTLIIILRDDHESWKVTMLVSSRGQTSTIQLVSC